VIYCVTHRSSTAKQMKVVDESPFKQGGSRSNSKNQGAWQQNNATKPPPASPVAAKYQPTAGQPVANDEEMDVRPQLLATPSTMPEQGVASPSRPSGSPSNQGQTSPVNHSQISPSMKSQSSPSNKAAPNSPSNKASSPSSKGTALQREPSLPNAVEPTERVISTPPPASPPVSNGVIITLPRAPSQTTPTFNRVPSTPTRSCDACEENNASINCADCEEKLCANCDRLLHKVQGKQAHQRTNL